MAVAHSPMRSNCRPMMSQTASAGALMMMWLEKFMSRAWPKADPGAIPCEGIGNPARARDTARV
jgi:hypothetical protein